MATQEISDEAIFRATGAPWSHWLEVFSLMDAKSLPHKEIAAKLHDDHKVPSWWCQMLAVKYEKEIGRRETGSDSNRGYYTGLSATLDGDLDDLYEQWNVSLENRAEFNSVPIVSSPSLSQTDNWRYWKIKLGNGSKILVNMSQKSEDKVLVQIEHEKLPEGSSLEQWKSYWKSVIDDIYKK